MRVKPESSPLWHEGRAASPFAAVEPRRGAESAPHLRQRSRT